MGVGDFTVDPDNRTYAYARSAPRGGYRSVARYLRELRGSSARQRRICVDELDVLMLRNDPSEDATARPWARLAGINFGRRAADSGVIVLNDPATLALSLNKLYLHSFPDSIRPRTLVTREREAVISFIREHRGLAVLKPLIGSGGRGVFLVQPEDAPNVNQMFEAVSREGYVIVQEYLPEAVRGDTRLFLVNGVPLRCRGKVAALRRARREGDSDMRSNLTAGAVSRRAELSAGMLGVAAAVRDKLVEDGMFFVGLDIVGDKCLEINVFSPGGVDSAERFEKVPFSREIIHAIERKVAHVRTSGGQIDNVKIATY